MKTLPPQLTALHQWLNWRYETRDGKPTKVPYQPSGVHAKSNDPATWSSYEDAAARSEFVGFVFAADGEFFGLDLDECLIAGELAMWAGEIVNRFPNAYIEISPSGRGLKLFCRGSIKKGRSKKIGPKLDGADKAPGVEVYGQGRYFTVTGDVYQTGDLEADSLAGLAWLKAQYWPAAPSPAPLPVRPAIECDVDRRAAKYLEHCEPAISGQGGSNQTYSVCARLIHGFLLSPERAFTLLAEWNARCDPPWSEFDLRRKCEQAAKGNCNRSPGWLLAESREATPDDVGVDLSEFEVPAKILANAELAAADIDLSPADPGPFPIECVEAAPGLIGEIVSYDLRTAMYPQPTLALAGALAIMSVVTGRKIRGHGDTRTNLFLIGLAPSGSGKNHSRTIAKRLLTQCGASDLLGNERIGSHAGIISRLDAHPASLFLLDEVGDLLSLMKQTGGKLGAVANIEPTLKALYSAAGDQSWTGDALANLGHVKTINQPHLAIYGVCPPANYWGNITGANIENGLLARFIVFEAGHVLPIWRADEEELPGNVVEAVRRWWRFSPGGELSAVFPTPKRAEYTPEAFQIFREHVEAIAQRRIGEDERTAAIWSRCAEKVGKLALLAGCARCDDPASDAILVTAEDIRWAKRIAIWSTRRMVWRVSDSVSENAEDERKKMIARMIPFWPETISASVLTRKTQKLKRSERQSAIDDLVASGIIREERIASESGPAKTFFHRAARPSLPGNAA